MNMEQFDRMFYETWVASKNYRDISVVESKETTECFHRIEEAAGNDRISDEYGHLLCEAEYVGFKNGLRYGAFLISGILGDGSLLVEAHGK